MGPHASQIHITIGLSILISRFEFWWAGCISLVHPTNVRLLCLNIVHLCLWLYTWKREFTTIKTWQQANPKHIINCTSLVSLPRKTYILNTFHCYTSTGPGHIGVSYNHLYVPVCIWGLKLGCTATSFSVQKWVK